MPIFSSSTFREAMSVSIDFLDCRIAPKRDAMSPTKEAEDAHNEKRRKTIKATNEDELKEDGSNDGYSHDEGTSYSDSDYEFDSAPDPDYKASRQKKISYKNES